MLILENAHIIKVLVKTLAHITINGYTTINISLTTRSQAVQDARWP